MKTTTLSFVTATLLGAGVLVASAIPTTSFADAGDAPPAPAADRPDGDGPRWHHDGEGRRWGREGGRHGDMARRHAMMERAAARNPNIAVLMDAHQLERAYRADGRVKEIPGLYRDLIAKSTDPNLTRLLNQRLARVEMREGNKKAAIDALRRNLDADVQRAAAAKPR
jgi:hypothetical protein